MKPHNISNVDDMTEDEFLESLDADDYLFVLDKNGVLKNVILPENYEETELPREVQSILEMYGLSVGNLNQLH